MYVDNTGNINNGNARRPRAAAGSAAEALAMGEAQMAAEPVQDFDAGWETARTVDDLADSITESPAVYALTYDTRPAVLREVARRLLIRADDEEWDGDL